jgi:hypothetical protein
MLRDGVRTMQRLSFTLFICACGSSNPAPFRVPPTSVIVAPLPTAAPAPVPATPAAPDRSRANAAIVRILTPAPQTPSWDPRRAWLERYREEDGRIELVLGARDGSDVAAFAKQLAASGELDDIRLESGERDDALVSTSFRAKSHEPSRRLRVESPGEATPILGAGERNPLVHDALPPEPHVVSEADASSLRVVGVASAGTSRDARAMLTDASGNGVIVVVGDLVGPARCRYRVDRIDPDVRLVKETANACATEPPTRVLSRKK